jgi:hypothetical protein
MEIREILRQIRAGESDHAIRRTLKVINGNGKGGNHPMALAA